MIILEPFSFFVAGTRNVRVNPLLAGDDVSLRAGITDGPGNQGTANTAMNMGHAGTPASQTGVPRQLKAGGGSLVGTS